MENSNVIEVRGLSTHQILEEFFHHQQFKSEWLRENFVKGILECDFMNKNKKETFWLWLLNGFVVGLAYLRQKENYKATVSFRIKEKIEPSTEIIQKFVEETVMKSFDRYPLEKIIYDCGEKCNTPVSKAFLERFDPHPIGWVHLSNGKFALTRGQIDQTEEEFYKI